VDDEHGEAATVAAGVVVLDIQADALEALSRKAERNVPDNLMVAVMLLVLVLLEGCMCWK